MRQKDIDFLNYIFEVIEKQIQSYGALARIGVGPDARLIARLDSHQVTALLACANRLLNSVTADGIDPDVYTNVFGEVEFYVKHEYLRSSAGHLVDDNNVHNATYKRAASQHERLKSFETAATKQQLFKLTNDAQRQHEHDSRAIAYFVVDTACTLIANPEAEIEAKEAFGHGLDKMRQHAIPGGRYHDPEIAAQLKETYDDCKLFLMLSRLTKSTDLLLSPEAKVKQDQDRKTLSSLRERFSQLRAQTTQNTQTTKPTCRCSASFFAKATVAVLTVSAVVAGIAMRNS